MRLKDKVAIITGAGAGIGEAVAHRFAEEGARLVLNDLNPGPLEGVAKATGGEAVAGDISKEETARKLAERAIGAYGAVDILVNNAADFTQMNVEAADLEHWRKVLDVNVIGTAMVSKHAIPHLKASKNGAIVHVASMSGVIAQPNFTTYAASKGAVIQMTRTMALDLAPFNVRVNSVSPGCVVTTATRREWERFGLTFEEWSAQWAPLHMLNRIGEAREVANAVLFLASDEASFITGANLMVDGGYTAK